MRFLSLALVLLAACASPSGDAVPMTSPGPMPAPAPQDGKLRIIAFGAHPDDCELREGGCAAKWAALGHHVKFVSVTNG
ncbi:MAG: PIG-L family deacetylase, partial [Planctomycetaceae bacterium]|nr:PIG-L family deacetylase [Planctomycetaceae bacterium]